jgi:hypothetical protein
MLVLGELLALQTMEDEEASAFFDVGRATNAEERGVATRKERAAREDFISVLVSFEEELKKSDSALIVRFG